MVKILDGGQTVREVAKCRLGLWVVFFYGVGVLVMCGDGGIARDWIGKVEEGGGANVGAVAMHDGDVLVRVEGEGSWPELAKGGGCWRGGGEFVEARQAQRRTEIVSGR